MFSLTIETENAAFQDGAEGATETAAILRNVADRLEGGTREGKTIDSNGNKVGAFALFEPAPDRDEWENIGGGCANVYLASLLRDAMDRAEAGQPLTRLDLAALTEAAERISEHADDDDSGDYYGPDGSPLDDAADSYTINPAADGAEAGEVVAFSGPFAKGSHDWKTHTGGPVAEGGFYWITDDGAACGPFADALDATKARDAGQTPEQYAAA